MNRRTFLAAMAALAGAQPLQKLISRAEDTPIHATPRFFTEQVPEPNPFLVSGGWNFPHASEYLNECMRRRAIAVAAGIEKDLLTTYDRMVEMVGAGL
jgi:hypothetical protein